MKIAKQVVVYVIVAAVGVLSAGGNAEALTLRTVNTVNSGLNLQRSGSILNLNLQNNLIKKIPNSSQFTPYLVGTAKDSKDAEGIVYRENRIYVADAGYGFKIIDVANPQFPYSLGSLNTLHYARNLAIDGNYAYVVDHDLSLKIIDISNLSSPKIISTYTTRSTAQDAFVASIAGKKYLALADNARGVQIIDVTNPAKPVMAALLDYNNYPDVDIVGGVYIVGNYLYVADGMNGIGKLHIFDLGQPTAPALLGSVSFAGEANKVRVLNGIAYVASDKGLVIINVTNNTKPAVVGTYGTQTPAMDVVIQVDAATQSSMAYLVADNSYNSGTPVWGGLYLINVSNPQNPTSTWNTNTSGRAYAVAVSGNYCYVANYTSGVAIYKIK